MRQVIGLLHVLAPVSAFAQSASTLSLVLDGPTAVEVNTPVELQVVASFNHRLSGVAFQVDAQGPTGAYLTARSANPAEINGLTYISAVSQDPFDPQLPQDLTAGPVVEVLMDLDYPAGPGGLDDGILPGSNVIVERLEVTPTQTGSLTIILSNVQVLTTETDPNGSLFDTVNISQDRVTIDVTNNAALTANAGSDRVSCVHSNTVSLNGSASGGSPPYSYRWVLLQQPSGSGSVSIATADSSNTTATLGTPMLAGIYEFRLTVTDAAQAGAVDTFELTLRTDHPADTGEDWSASISEVTAYGACWRTGCTWSMPPNPVPIEAVTRIGFLWRQGESYHYDPALGYPDCWQPGAPGAPAGTLMASDPISTAARPSAIAVDAAGAVRSITADADHPGRFLVSIAVRPPSAASAWALEEQLPAGWTTHGMNEGGGFDATNQRTKWGPFFDTQLRQLSYTLARPENASGGANLTGVLSVDGHNSDVSGDSLLAAFDNNGSARFSPGSLCGPGILEALLCTSLFMFTTSMRRRSKT